MELVQKSNSHYIPHTEHFYDLSRVWIYQADRTLSESETNQLKQSLAKFTNSWTSHRVRVNAAAEVYYNRFIVFMADDSYTDVGGCSIDSLLKEVQQIQKDFNLNLLDRLQLAIMEDNKVNVYHKDELIDLIKSGKVNENDLLFDNLVNTKKQFEEQWLKPIKESWLMRFI